ncbi:hypothetical protein DLJ82_1689 [Rhizobium leguminosarum]|uniref:Uncharacterized protein n=1 Tax=Rhizobium leguminosarum TaxID=384 RepID=A0A2Z4YDG3_RHILE|nr:hypothetical protein DLJ82_1689 [Rhizobium leguminosarum]
MLKAKPDGGELAYRMILLGRPKGQAQSAWPPDATLPLSTPTSAYGV